MTTPTASQDAPRASLGDAAHYLAIAVIVAGVGTGAYYGFRAELAGTPRFWLYVASPTVVFAGLGLLRAHRDGDLGSWMKPVWGDPTRGILSGALLVLCGLFAVHLLAPAQTPRDAWMARLYLQFGDPDVLREHMYELVPAIVAVAAAEEILWRGLVTQLLAERIGSRHAWIVGFVLYAAAHLPTMWVLADPRAGLNPMVVVGALGAGFVWSAMARYFGRLTPSIISHATFDWCVIMVFRLWGTSV